jgi:hypothetical protein
MSVGISIYLWLYSPLLDLGRFFSSLFFYTVGRTPWTGDEPVTRPLPTHRTAQTQNKRTKTSMPWVGFEPTISAFERAKTVYALDRSATVVGESRGRAVSIATGYELDDRGAEVRIPIGATFFSFPCRPDRFWGPPSLLSIGYRGLLPRGVKRPWREADASLPISAEFKNTWFYTSTPPYVFMV